MIYAKLNWYTQVKEVLLCINSGILEKVCINLQKEWIAIYLTLVLVCVLIYLMYVINL